MNAYKLTWIPYKIYEKNIPDSHMFIIQKSNIEKKISFIVEIYTEYKLYF